MKDTTLLILFGLIFLMLGLGFFRVSSRLSRIESAMNKGQTAGVADPPPDAYPMAVSYDLPETLDFAGEPVPLHRKEIREQLDKEMQINIYFHSNTMFLIKRANRWLPEFEKILREQNIPDDFKYMPLIESALINDISPRQAVGFWQFIKTAGKEFDLEINREVDERYDPIKSTVAACKYLRKAHDRFNNWTLAAASYDRGMSGLNKALDRQHVDSYYDLYLNEETTRYVFRILAIKQIIENPEAYGFRVDTKHLYQPDSVRHVEVNETIPDLISFAKEKGITYKILKLYNPWLRDDRLTVRRGKTYQLALPAIPG